MLQYLYMLSNGTKESSKWQGEKLKQENIRMIKLSNDNILLNRKVEQTNKWINGNILRPDIKKICFAWNLHFECNLLMYFIPACNWRLLATVYESQKS